MKAPIGSAQRPYAFLFNKKDYSHSYHLFSDGGSNSEMKKKEQDYYNVAKELNYVILPNEDVQFVN